MHRLKCFELIIVDYDAIAHAIFFSASIFVMSSRLSKLIANSHRGDDQPTKLRFLPTNVVYCLEIVLYKDIM